MMLSADDRAALTDLVHRYAARVDDRQFTSLADLFTDDAELMLPDPPAVLDPVTTHRGHPAIGAALVQRRGHRPHPACHRRRGL